MGTSGLEGESTQLFGCPAGTSPPVTQAAAERTGLWSFYSHHVLLVTLVTLTGRGCFPKSTDVALDLLMILQEEVMALFTHLIPVWTWVSSIYLKAPVPRTALGSGEIRRERPASP